MAEQVTEFRISLQSLKDGVDPTKYEPYHFGGGRYLVLRYCDKTPDTTNPSVNYHGFISLEEIESLIGTTMYQSFLDGERVFVVTRNIL